MNKLFQNKAFDFGFFYGISTFITLNFLSYLFNKIDCADCSYKFGFPFYLHEYGGFTTVDEFIWFGLIADIFIGVVFSFTVGLVFKFIWSKIFSHRSPLK